MLQQLFWASTHSFLVFLLSGHSALADLRVIIVDEDRLPYELGSSNYDNSPSNYANSESNYENSGSNYENSESNYKNSASNYDNGISGSRRIISGENEFVGYYVFSDSGVMNIFGASGKRVAYKPTTNDTQSVFSSSGEWCGTVGEQEGEVVLGIVESCFFRLLLDN